MNLTNDDKTVINSVESLQLSSNNDCRICFEKCNEVWQIFHPTNEEIPRKLMEFAAVQVQEGDGLPSTICHNCRRLLDVSYDFKCQVEQSDAKFREILMLKDTTEADDDDDEKFHSLSQSVNAAITEAIADEIAHDRGVNVVNECTDLVGTLNEHETSHNIVDELHEHHYISSHHEPIIFRIEPPNHQHHDQCSLEQSLTSMNNVDVCDIVDDKHIEMSVCNDNRVVNVLIDKYDDLVDSTSITRDAYKTEPMLMSDNELSDNTCNPCNMANIAKNEDMEIHSIMQENVEFDEMKNEHIDETLINVNDTNLENLKDNYESDDEEKPLIARTQRQKCPNCIKTFATKISLERHVEIHKKKTNLRYVCYMCDKQFANITKLKNHVILCHESLQNDDEKMIDDTNENITIQDKQLLRTESKKSMKFCCKICGKQFTYQKSFLSHAKTHPGYEPVAIIEKDENVAVSEESNERENDSQEEQRAEEEDDDDDDMPIEGLQCTQCGKLFATKRNLKRHISTHSGLKFNCTTCSKEFSRIDKLKEHEQSKHKDEFFASSDTDSDDDTDNENKNHDGSDSRKKEKHNRPHQCPMCPKAFAQEQSLTNHMERHKRVKDTVKRFLCEVCSKCFAQSGSLVAHMRTHTGVKPYVCNVCTRAFTKSTYLQLHLRTHSGEKPYICQYCSRAFARANTLARHITMHTGEAKYRCQICMKSFRRLTSLNEHNYTHTGQRPYACKICAKRYNNAGSLYAHTKKCKAQQVTGTTSFALPIDDEIHENDGGTTTAAESQEMLNYSQRKFTDNSTIVPIGPTPQFMITNFHNPSLKTLPNNIIQQFDVEEQKFCNVTPKSCKNPYYMIYPNM